MLITVEFWQLVLLLVSFFAACAGAGKTLLNQSQRHMDERFSGITSRLDGIESTNRKDAVQWRQLERDLMTLKSELPFQYVMREDYIRGQSILEAKIDGLAIKMENAQLRGLIGGSKNDN